MRLLLLNITLAVLWMVMWGQIDIYTLLFGFALGWLLLAIMSSAFLPDGVTPYGRKLVSLISFTLYFIQILIKANLQVAREIITPGLSMTPAILRYEVTGLTPLQLTSLANAITLTPGTLSLDVSDDDRFLYIHCMYAQDRNAAIKDLDELRDRLLKEVFA